MVLLRKSRLVDVTSAPTPERAALAHAIADHAEALAVATATEEAIRRAEMALGAAYEAVRTAEAAISTSREAMVAHLVDVAVNGEAGAPPQTVREAEAALTDAKDARAMATMTRDVLEGSLPDTRGKLSLKASKLKEAALAVIASEAIAHAVGLAEAVQAVQVEALRKGAALAWLAKAGALAMEQQTFMRVVADPAARAALDWQRWAIEAPAPDGWNRAAAAAGTYAWDDALAALQRDAAAPLPL